MARRSVVVATGVVVEEELWVERPSARAGGNVILPSGEIVPTVVPLDQYVLGRLSLVQLQAVYKGLGTVSVGETVRVFRPGLEVADEGTSLPEGSTVLVFLVQPIPVEARLPDGPATLHDTVVKVPGAPFESEEAFDFEQAYGLLPTRGATTVSGPATLATIDAAIAEVTTTNGGASNRAPSVTIRIDACQAPCTVTLWADAIDPDQDALDYKWVGCTTMPVFWGHCAVAAGGSVHATVTVSDRKGGSASASATFNSQSPALSASPLSVAFGITSLGSTVQKVVTVTNSGGGTLAGSGTVTGAGFSILAASSYSLAPGQSTALTVRFAPTSAGAASGSLVLSGGGGAIVPLSGTGSATAATLSVSTTTTSGGQSVVVTVSGGPGNPSDAVGLYSIGAPDASPLRGKYLNGNASPPANGLSSAALQFNMPTAIGNYEFRLLANGLTSIATSPAVNIQGLSAGR